MTETWFGLVWKNRKKISKIFNDYLCLPFFLLFILWMGLTLPVCGANMCDKQHQLPACGNTQYRGRRMGLPSPVCCANMCDNSISCLLVVTLTGLTLTVCCAKMCEQHQLQAYGHTHRSNFTCVLC